MAGKESQQGLRFDRVALDARKRFEQKDFVPRLAARAGRRQLSAGELLADRPDRRGAIRQILAGQPGRGRLTAAVVMETQGMQQRQAERWNTWAHDSLPPAVGHQQVTAAVAKHGDFLGQAGFEDSLRKPPHIERTAAEPQCQRIRRELLVPGRQIAV